MPKIHFVDVTNRDAVQASRLSLSKLERSMINLLLAQLGIYQSEFAFPSLKHEHNYVVANLELKQLGAMGPMILGGWCRAIVPDVAAALPTGIKDLNISISTSDQMIIHKFRGKLNRERVIQEMVEAATFAKKEGIKTLGVNAEDASRTDMGYLIEFAQAAKGAGANRIRYCDTLGCDTPMSIYRRVKQLAERVKIPVELHCHNDLGMAVANSVAGAQAAVDAGADTYINGSVNGVGERAGQADLLSCVLAFKFAPDLTAYEIGDPIELKVARRLAGYVSYAFNIPIPINQPGVGDNTFAHEAGIHADGALKDRRNYELFDYEDLGEEVSLHPRGGRIISAGEFSGLSGLKHVYLRLGIDFPDDGSAQHVLTLVQYASTHTQSPLTDNELRFIAHYPEQARKILTITP